MDYTKHPLQVNALLEQHNSVVNGRRRSLLQRVKEILDYSGYSYLWYSDNSLYDPVYVCNMIRNRITNMYIQTSLHNISIDTGKLRFYKTCKSVYAREKYLELVDFELRSAISKVRISAHPLEVERGRYKRLPVCERICKYCTSKAVGDETHFISKCSFNETERITLFREVTKTYPNFPTLTDKQKATFLLKSQNPQILENVGLFVSLCFQKRSQTQPANSQH